jgi:hypothetical protein
LLNIYFGNTFIKGILDTKALSAYNLRMKSHTQYASNVPKNIYVAWCIAKYNEDCISIENYNKNMKLPEDSIGLEQTVRQFNSTIKDPIPTLGDLDKLTIVY